MKSLFSEILQGLFALIMYALAAVYFGLAWAPGVYLILKVWGWTFSQPLSWRSIYLAIGAACAYFIFGLILTLLAGLSRTLLGLNIKEGKYPVISPPSVQWALVNCFYLMVQYTFINFLLLTPFINIYLRLLGAKIGKNVQINSRLVYDAPLMEIGDNSVIGGETLLIGHSVERGRFTFKKVKIGKNVTVGTHAKIMPGCEIGDGAIIGAGAVLLKNTKVQPHSVWHGVPAQNARDRRGRGPADQGGLHE